MKPVHTLKHCFFYITFLISSFPYVMVFQVLSSLQTFRQSSCTHFSFSMCAICPFYFTLFDHSNNIFLRVQIMKLIMMQFSAACSHFISPSFEYSPQAVLLHRQSVYQFVPRQNNRQTYLYHV